MKKIFIALLIVCLLFVGCACSSSPKINNAMDNDAASPMTPSNLPQGNLDDSGNALTATAPYTFTSIDAFEAHERSVGSKAVTSYYVPKNLSSDYTLSTITKRDDVYVMFEYAVSASKAASASKLSEYDAERLQTLICRCSLYEDGKTALKESFIDQGFEKIEYNGKTYHRWDEHAENNPEKRVIGYEIAFLEDGKLIFMHLPAVDTFENMMQFATLQKMIIQ